MQLVYIVGDVVKKSARRRWRTCLSRKLSEPALREAALEAPETRLQSVGINPGKEGTIDDELDCNAPRGTSILAVSYVTDAAVTQPAD